MFNSKLEVDRHVENCLKRIGSELEKNMRCFSFSKLYFQVGAYEQAHRYLLTYLYVQPLSADAQLWLGKTLEKMGKKAAALEAYKTSLNLEPKQNNLVIKICELLASDDINLDHSLARYYCEKAQSFEPYHPTIFNLKERLIASESKDPHDVTNLLLKELETRPLDVCIRIRLVQHLMQHNYVFEAYKHALEIEKKHLPVFLNSLGWYEAVTEVMMAYLNERALGAGMGWEFWMAFISCLDKLITLSLQEHSYVVKGSMECTAAVFNMDQKMKLAVASMETCAEKALALEFVNHYTGQLCLHFVTLLYKQARKELIKYKEVTQVCLPLLFAAYNFRPVDLHGIWLEHNDSFRPQAQRWNKEASFRCTQVGHMLRSLAKDRSASITDKAGQNCTGLWRDQIYKKIFITRDYQAKIKSSFFTTCSQLLDISIRLPDPKELIETDKTAQLVNPDSLHHYVWIGLNNKLSNFSTITFQGLQYSVKNLNHCGAETLNILDIDAFIYCTILCVQAQIDESKHTVYYRADKPAVLPIAVTDELGTINQAKWLKAAYRMFKNYQGSELSELRVTLIRGIECVRCVGNHGLDVRLLVALAKTFAKRATKLTKQSEIEFNEARAELYWRNALPLLEKLRKNQAISFHSNRIFEYKAKDMSENEILHSIGDGKLFTASQMLRKKDYENALIIFKELKDPEASFNQAQIYKIMADKELNQNKENVTSEMRSQHIILLTKARDCLYLTLDRLRDPSIDRKHPLNEKLANEIEKIERLLSRIDPDPFNHNECDGVSEETASSNESNENYRMNLMHHTPRNNHNHTRKEARPSPERLDAQLRQMAASRDSVINHLLDQNKVILEKIDSLDQSYKDIKKAVDERQDMRNLTDIIYEMRKEISELKKDNVKIKSNQLSDEDLYVLEEEYANDFTNSNVAGLTPSLYPNLGRLPGAAAAYATPTLYPGMYPMYPYPGLVLPQAGGALQYPDPQITDFRSMSSLSHGLAQPPLPSAYPQIATLPQQPTLQPPSSQQQQQHIPVTPHQQYSSPLAQLQQQTNNLTSLFKDGPTITTSSTMMAVTTKALPVNVVITTSDPLPSSKTVTSTPQILSVTIPLQHLKQNKVHNYQIPMPPVTVSSAPSVLAHSPMPISTQGLLSNVAPPVYSAVSDAGGLGVQIERSIAQSFNNKSANDSNLSASSIEEHDPCPDFQPIVPLPDEVPVNTGEENEEILFCERAKLFRFVDKEWKERGVGELKLLWNPESKKVRLLMRRDQVHKICANHYLNENMLLVQKKNNEKAYTWAANDFADEKIQLETFCVQFKTPEIGKRFSVEFETAKIKSKAVEKPNLGGFKFTSTPTFQPKDDEPVKAAASEGVKITSPFASFTFATTPKTGAGDALPQKSLFSNLVSTPTQTKSFTNMPVTSKDEQLVKPNPITPSTVKLDTSESAEDFEPNVEFRPVIPLPDLVDLKTGEENAEVMFEAKAKLLRYDATSKEWKERGVGIMKVLKEDTIRLVMRREQVHKVCCNHQLFKNMEFKPMKNSTTALTWGAQDFSEGKLTTELFAIRFKTEDVTKNFTESLQKAKDMLDDNNFIKQEKEKRVKPESPAKSNNWTDKFKQTWTCKTCGTVNEQKDAACEACDTQRVEKKNDQKSSDSQFCFGVGQKVAPATSTMAPQQGFGDKFKPKAGSWTCTVCYVTNDGEKTACISCETPKDGSAPIENTPTKTKGVDLSTGGLKFSFGVPASATPAVVTTSQFSFGTPKTTQSAATFGFAQTTAQSTPTEFTFANTTAGLGFVTPTTNVTTATATSTTAGFGDMFKPKTGSWECGSCYTRNDSGDYCLSCEAPRDSTIQPKQKQSSQIVDLSTPGLTFKFGINPSTPTTTCSAAPPTTFTFTQQPFSFAVKSTTTPTTPQTENVFGSPHKQGFEFTPRSPRRQSSGQGEEDSENSYYEEEEVNIYFKPLVSLPEVEVTTGEENEEVLYCHRSKLFRFVDGEWKERGLGDVKILHKADDNTLRVLMRREQVHKICLNHRLTPDVAYTPKDEKTWLFCAPDFSEGQIEYHKFCLRFKSADVAKGFKEHIDRALEKLNEPTRDVVKIPQPKQTTDSSSKDSSDDVIFISETKVTAAEEEEAKRLMLPPKFMSYRQLPDCECAQCKKDDLYENVTRKSFFADAGFGLKSVFGNVKPEETKTAGLTFGSQSFVGTPPTKEGGRMFLGNGAVTITAVDKKSLIKPPMLGSTTITPVGSATTTSLIFGSATITPTVSKGTFGGKPVFGGSSAQSLSSNVSLFNIPTTVQSPSIFGNTKSSTPSLLAALSATPKINTTTAVTPAPFNFADDKKTSGLSFSALASTAPKAFLEPSGDNNAEDIFASLGAGAPVFGAVRGTPKEKDKDVSGDGEKAADEEYDPYYAPIVPLPEAIVVTTGEEEEEIMFNEKGKLFRHSDMEWKERGIGQVKVLHHPVKGTYRMLLRRDQVHKVVLNELITADLDLKPHSLSTNAWTWVGHNFCENEMNIEKLALRFKNETIYNQFNAAVQKAIAAIKEKAHAPAPEQVVEAAPPQHDIGHQFTMAFMADAAPEYSEEVCNETDEDDEEDYDAIFAANCKLSECSPNGEWNELADEASVEIWFDPDIMNTRISVTNTEDDVLSITTIAPEVNMERVPDDNGTECVYQALDSVGESIQLRNLKLTFEDASTAERCYCAFIEGMGINIPHIEGGTDED